MVHRDLTVTIFLNKRVIGIPDLYGLRLLKH